MKTFTKPGISLVVHDVQQFASNEAGQSAKARLALLELAAAKAAPETLTYSLTPPSSDTGGPAPPENSPIGTA